MATWLARIRDAVSPQEGAQALRGLVDEESRFRVFLYRNEKDLAEVFVQRQDNVTQLLSGKEVAVEASGGYLGFFNARAARKNSASATIEMTPFVRQLLLERTEGERGALVDLAVTPPRPGALLYFVGPGLLIGPWGDVSDDKAAGLLTGEDVATVRQERAEQKHKMQWGRPDHPGTIVWIAHGGATMAAIGSYEFVERGNFGSYEPHPPFGFFGMYESQRDNVMMLKPLTIWHESVNRELGVGGERDS